MSYDFKALLEYARTDKQIEAVELCIKHGSISQAAIHAGVRRENIRGHIKIVRNYAAKKGYAPEMGMNTPTADGFQVKGTSTLYKDGEAVIQWVKTSQDAERQLELMKEAIDAFKEDLPKYAPINPPNIINSHLLNHITLSAFGDSSIKPLTTPKITRSASFKFQLSPPDSLLAQSPICVSVKVI